MRTHLILAGLLIVLTACGGTSRHAPVTKQIGNFKLGQPYEIAGRWYYPEFDPNYNELGIASWYGEAFHGRPTANGEVFDRHSISAAHTTLPMPSIVEVTNLENGKSLVLRVNDRGPFVGDRIIDLSEAAARELDFHKKGLAEVRVRFLRLATDARGTPPSPTVASAAPKPVEPAAGPAIAPVAQAPASPVCRQDQHFVQVAALSDVNRARSIADHIQTVGPVWQEPIQAGTLHRVRIGPLSNRRQAFDILSQLRQLGYREAYVDDCEPTLRRAT